MKFYDVATKKPVNIPDGQIAYVIKIVKGKKLRMATAIGPRGNKLWKIIGWV